MSSESAVVGSMQAQVWWNPPGTRRKGIVDSEEAFFARVFFSTYLVLLLISGFFELLNKLFSLSAIQ